MIYQAIILENKKISRELHQVKLLKPEGFSHQISQYVEFSPEDPEQEKLINPVYLGLSSHPDEPHLEFIVHNRGEATSKLCASGPGIGGYFSQPLGSGFAPELYRSKTLYMVAHGSAISAIKPAVEEVRKNRSHYGPARLIYGAKSPEDLPFRETLRDWMGAVEVYDIVSEAITDKARWNGETGYVQDVIRKIEPSPENAVALLAGSPEMVKEVSSILETFGFAANQILTNL